jgi:hypothetical protein
MTYELNRMLRAIAIAIAIAIALCGERTEQINFVQELKKRKNSGNRNDNK